MDAIVPFYKSLIFNINVVWYFQVSSLSIRFATRLHD